MSGKKASSGGWLSTGTGTSGRLLQHQACPSSRSVWTMLSSRWCDSWSVLRRARSWTVLPWQGCSGSAYSLIQWFWSGEVVSVLMDWQGLNWLQLFCLLFILAEDWTWTLMCERKQNLRIQLCIALGFPFVAQSTKVSWKNEMKVLKKNCTRWWK